MFQLVGLLVALATFPGVVVHEIAHLFFCRRARLQVYGYSLFRLGNPTGFVLHERPKRLRDALAITVAPALVNSVGAVLAAWFCIQTALFAMRTLGTFAQPVAVLFYYGGLWLGVSLGTHAFPSLGDAKSLWREVRDGGHGFFGWLLGAPTAGLIVLGSVASFVWLDVVYGFVLAGLASAIVSEAARGLGITSLFALEIAGVLLTTAFGSWLAMTAFSDRALPRGRALPGPRVGLGPMPTKVESSPAGSPAGWRPDPLHRHEHRFWNGTSWTDHVADAGVASTDRWGS